MELEKNKISINQIVAQKLDTAICEGDCIVPDIKPDIYNIITSSGTVSIYKKEVMDGRVRIDGAINTYTIYSSEEEGRKEIRSINYVIDFSQVVNIENAKSDEIAEVNTRLRSVEARIVNERKINVKAMLDFDIKLFANNSEEFITDIKDMQDLQKLVRTITVNSLLGTAKTKAQVKETISIDGIDNLTEILKVNVDITNKDTKISYNKILAKADAKLKIMYLTEDNRINTVSATLPIMGFIDMENISEENVCDMQYEIRNLVIKPNSMQEHSIYVEAEIEITASCYETKEINTIEDLYSPSRNLSFEQKQIKAMQNKKNFHDVYSIREKQLLNIGDEKIYDADVRVNIDNMRIGNDEIELSGNVSVTFIHSINNMQEIGTTMLELPVNYRMSCVGIRNDSQVKVDMDIPLQDFTILPGGEVEVKIDIEFFASTGAEIMLNEICDVKEDENNEDSGYNMVIYFTKKEDNLWKIAKEFRSTMQNIKESNGLSQDTLTPGMQLFITKYVGANC